MHQNVAMRREASEAKIGALQGDLIWAWRHVQDLESAARERELRVAQLSEPEISRLFEIEAPDGRKFRQSAISAKALEQSLQTGYRVTGQVFPGGYVKQLDGPSPMFEGWLAAHGPELLKWLSEQAVVIRRDV
jgi:hypothetical protein